MVKFTNETLVQRIMTYVALGAFEQAETLAKVGDHLEACYLWDVEFDAL